MAIRTRLIDEETDTLPEEIDDLDKAYIQKMKADGIDEELVGQFMDMLSALDPQSADDK